MGESDGTERIGLLASSNLFSTDYHLRLSLTTADGTKSGQEVARIINSLLYLTEIMSRNSLIQNW